MPTVRDARTGDANVCAAIHVSSWKVAYAGMMPSQYLDSLTIGDRLPNWERMLASEQPAGTHILVVEDESGVQGFASCRPLPGDARTGEVGAIYLDPDAWGRGLGTALMKRIVNEARADGLRELTLWVHPMNERARAFYERRGWADDGEERQAVVWGLDVPERRYRFVIDA